MKRVLVGKVGQKVFFNRDSEEVKRSNTNGNVGLYKLMKLMFDNMPDVEFWLASKNDGTEQFSNVVDASSCDFLDLAPYEFDAFILIAGLAEYEKDERFINIANDAGNHCKKTLLLAEDPRCIDSLSKSERFHSFMPDKILAQQDGLLMFRDKVMFSEYFPLELASCYEEKVHIAFGVFNRTGAVIMANTTGTSYDRVGIVADVLDGTNVHHVVYGSLSGDDERNANRFNHGGEIGFRQVENELECALVTYCVPIHPHWVTSKYVEALVHGVLPIFHSDYGVELLSVDDGLLRLADTKEEFESVYAEASTNRVRTASTVRELQKKLVIPYVDGAALAEMIKEEAGLND